MTEKFSWEDLVEDVEDDDDTAIELGKVMMVDVDGNGNLQAFISWDGDEMPIMSSDVADTAFVMAVLANLKQDVEVGMRIADVMMEVSEYRMRNGHGGLN